MTPSRVCATRNSATPASRTSAITFERGKLWDAFVSPARPVLLIDEIDKADIEFPNDLLLELDQMEFHVDETGETVRAARRPMVLITSNNEKELPDAFLRRCFFHYIRFPDAETMRAIVEFHYPGIKPKLIEEAMRCSSIFATPPDGRRSRPTSELLDWLKLLLNEDIGPEAIRERDAKKLIPPLHGALLKNEQDVHLFENAARLAIAFRDEGLSSSQSRPLATRSMRWGRRRALSCIGRIGPSICCDGPSKYRGRISSFLATTVL